MTVEFDSKYFTVKGTLSCACACDHSSHLHLHRVRETVLAANPTDALSRVVKLICDHFNYMDATWLGEPSLYAQPLPEYERMRLVGAPTLPGLADVKAKGGPNVL